MRIVESVFVTEFVTEEDVDTGIVKGCAQPWAHWLWQISSAWTPSSRAQSLYEEFGEPLYAPPLLLRMVDVDPLAQERPRLLQ